jgi:hypothetical protein
LEKLDGVRAGEEAAAEAREGKQGGSVRAFARSKRLHGAIERREGVGV